MTLVPLTPEQEAQRKLLHDRGPAGYAPCTRPWPHAGPCAHPPAPDVRTLSFRAELEHRCRDWLEMMIRASDGHPDFCTCLWCSKLNEFRRSIP